MFCRHAVRGRDSPQSFSCGIESPITCRPALRREPDGHARSRCEDSNTPSACCLRPSNEPGQPGPPSNIFARRRLVFPRRVRSGPHTGELHWMPLQHSTVLNVLRNPRYAGAFCFGRTQTRKHPDGSLHTQVLPQEQWLFLIQEVHPGYINWEEYEGNLTQLRANRQAHGEDRRHGAPREGPARLARALTLWTLRQPHDRSLP